MQATRAFAHVKERARRIHAREPEPLARRQSRGFSPPQPTTLGLAEAVVSAARPESVELASWWMAKARHVLATVFSPFLDAAAGAC